MPLWVVTANPAGLVAGERYVLGLWCRRLACSLSCGESPKFKQYADGYYNYFANAAGSMFANGAYGPKALAVSHKDNDPNATDAQKMAALYYKANPVPGWDLYVIDSECTKQAEGSRVGDNQNGCDVGSLQYEWLKTQLQNSSNQCQIVAMHRPLWNSRDDSNPAFSGPLVESSLDQLRQLFETYDVELVVAGHAHDYERFYPKLANQVRDDANGFQTFVIGTGGRSHEPLSTTAGTASHSAVEIVDKYGVVEFDLQSGSYGWNFISVTAPGHDTWTNSGAPRVSKSTVAAANIVETVLDSGQRGCN